MTILYAEDDSMTVMEVQEKLENNGYEVIVAYDGNEALEKFIACKPDLIVLDVDMPGKDGLEVLQFIRLQDSQTPVIIYSCLIDEEKQIKGLEWGANVYATVKIEVQHHPPLPPSLERSGKGGERGGG